MNVQSYFAFFFSQPLFDESLKWPEHPYYLDIDRRPSIGYHFREKYLDVWKKISDSAAINDKNISNL